MSRFIKKLHIRNLLSFDDCDVELRDLNVLIGANGSGKSNLIEVIGLLQSLCEDHAVFINNGGGPAAWLWKGTRRSETQLQSTLSSVGFGDLRHSFTLDGVTPNLSREDLLIESSGIYAFKREGTRLDVMEEDSITSYSQSDSLLKYRSPIDRTPRTEIADAVGKIAIYRGFETGADRPLRLGIAHGNTTRLDGNGQNLPLILHEAYIHGWLDAVDNIVAELGLGYRRVKPRSEAGMWKVLLFEDQLTEPIPSRRLSDGTLRFLCLAAILLHPQPPPVVCIEEPELGLHPDAMIPVARMLRDASERTQLIVTTHSVDLVNEFTSAPESILVTEKNEQNSTRFHRLDPGHLDAWLDEYRLGTLWRKGEIGGNRW